MRHSAEFRRCMEDLDVPQARKLWTHVFPHLPAPATDGDMLAQLHMGRTASKSVRFRLRAYSHAWLLGEGLPSMLPDELRPRAQRVYPVIAHAVGIATRAEIRTPEDAAKWDHIRKAMEGAVMEAAEEGKITDSAFVRARMAEARKAAIDFIYR